MKAFAVYLRVAVVLLVVGAIGLILFKNRSYTVSVWLFGLTDETKQVNVIWVILATAVSTLALWWGFALCRGLVRDVRALKREKEVALNKKRTDERMAELDARQRRIEQKLAPTVGDTPQDPADGY